MHKTSIQKLSIKVHLDAIIKDMKFVNFVSDLNLNFSKALKH